MRSPIDKLRYFINKVLYDFLWIVSRLFFFLFLDYKFESKENLKNLKPPLLIVINHASWLDSFLAGAIFPFNAKTAPIYFATWHKYYYSVLYPFFFISSTFPVRKGIDLEINLKEPIKILRNGGVVGIFPEGKRYHGGRPRKGRRGAAYLALRTGVQILPIEIKGMMNMTSSKFFFKRPKIYVKAKSIFKLPEGKKLPEDLNEMTDLIVEKLRG